MTHTYYWHYNAIQLSRRVQINDDTPDVSQFGYKSITRFIRNSREQSSKSPPPPPHLKRVIMHCHGCAKNGHCQSIVWDEPDICRNCVSWEFYPGSARNLNLMATWSSVHTEWLLFCWLIPVASRCYMRLDVAWRLKYTSLPEIDNMILYYTFKFIIALNTLHSLGSAENQRFRHESRITEEWVYEYISISNDLYCGPKVDRTVILCLFYSLFIRQ